MNIDAIFRALADPVRRRILEELSERDDQALFELHVRLVNWHSLSLSRQALAKHLTILEAAGLVRTEWRWRSKHHSIDREPLKHLNQLWLGPISADRKPVEENHEDSSHQPVR